MKLELGVVDLRRRNEEKLFKPVDDEYGLAFINAMTVEIQRQYAARIAENQVISSVNDSASTRYGIGGICTFIYVVVSSYLSLALTLQPACAYARWSTLGSAHLRD
jgi:hypothetical protein